MNIWTMIAVLFVVLVLVVVTWWQRRRIGSRTIDAERSKLVVPEDPAAISAHDTLAGIKVEEEWWKNLSTLQKLQLALHLAERAMPVWEKFAASQVVCYHPTSSGPLSIIESNLLEKTLEEINVHVRCHFPGGDTLKINQYHKRFIDPVLALKDGIWVCAYPVKKIFLSVYFILMSIVQQPGLSADESSLAEAINAALECMELSRLYTREEIAAFLTVYKNSLLQSQKPADQSGSASYIN